MSLNLQTVLGMISMEDGETANLGEIFEGVQEYNANPEEITVVTDETVTDLDKAVEDLAKDVEKGSDATETLDKLTGAQASLESKMILLQGMREKGINLNAHAARQFQKQVEVSMEAYGLPEGFFKSEMESFETSFESESLYDYSTEAEKKTEGIVAKIKAAIQKAIDFFIKVWRSIAGRFNEYTKSAIDLGNKLVKLADKMHDHPTRKLNSKSFPDISTGPGKVEPGVMLNELRKSGEKVNEGLTNWVNHMNSNAIEIFRINARDISDDVKKKNIEEVANKPLLFEHIQLNKKYKLVVDPININKFNVKVEDVLKSGEGEFEPLDKNAVKSLGRDIIAANSSKIMSDAILKNHISKIEAINKEYDKSEYLQGFSASAISRVISNSLKMVNSYNKEYMTVLNKVTKAAYRLGVASVNSYSRNPKAEASKAEDTKSE